MKFKITLEYQGDSFSGWQVQQGVRTVQGELERALAVFLASEGKKQGRKIEFTPVAVQGSGRTDAGVHAKGQVASFLWPDMLSIEAERLYAALNGMTSEDIVIKAVARVAESFDARFSPHCKLYCYRFLLRDGGPGLYSGRVWQVSSRGLDIEAMILAARLFTGMHDFSAFRAQDCMASTTERTVLASELARESEELLTLSLVGKGFLKQMVRIIAGTLYDVGRGRHSIADIAGALRGGARTAVGQTAPACGLTLEWVKSLKKK